MPTRARTKRPRDLNLLAISIVEEATGETLVSKMDTALPAKPVQIPKKSTQRAPRPHKKS